MLMVRGLTRPGLQPVDFSLEAGQTLAVTGPSGAGKSLMLRAIADLDPNDGDVWIDGTERRSVSAPQWRSMAGYVPAESGWWADTVAEHFTAGRPDAADLARIGLPEDVLTWQVARLSTGERHRLAILRSVLVNPRVHLLDEPTAALDEKATSGIETLLRERLALGCCIVLASHDERQVRRLADFVMTIQKGAAGVPEAVR
jgi:ABC-type iron transport system FetAB ATPase subunit